MAECSDDDDDDAPKEEEVAGADEKADDDANALCDAPERTKLVMERELRTRTITRPKNPEGTNGNA
jgi:hypothetical protein